jgi:DNA transformation protein and related proteins
MSRDDFAAYCVELLSGAGSARAKRMFGGHGLYLDERMVGVIVEERLYLKADAATSAAFVEAGGEQWVYAGKDKPVAMSYWSLPDEAYDSAEAMRPWARLALDAALRQPIKPARAKKAKAQAKP